MAEEGDNHNQTMDNHKVAYLVHKVGNNHLEDNNMVLGLAVVEFEAFLGLAVVECYYCPCLG